MSAGVAGQSVAQIRDPMIAVEVIAVERVDQARLDQTVMLHTDAHDDRNVR